jgi:hypothetical protein
MASAAKNWPAIPCTIVSTGVGSRPTSHSICYFVTVLFHYTYDGSPHASSRNSIGHTYTTFNIRADAQSAADQLLQKRATV